MAFIHQIPISSKFAWGVLWIPDGGSSHRKPFWCCTASWMSLNKFCLYFRPGQSWLDPKNLLPLSSERLRSAEWLHASFPSICRGPLCYWAPNLYSMTGHFGLNRLLWCTTRMPGRSGRRICRCPLSCWGPWCWLRLASRFYHKHHCSLRSCHTWTQSRKVSLRASDRLRSQNSPSFVSQRIYFVNSKRSMRLEYSTCSSGGILWFWVRGRSADIYQHRNIAEIAFVWATKVHRYWVLTI